MLLISSVAYPALLVTAGFSRATRPWPLLLLLIHNAAAALKMDWWWRWRGSSAVLPGEGELQQNGAEKSVMERRRRRRASVPPTAAVWRGLSPAAVVTLALRHCSFLTDL